MASAKYKRGVDGYYQARVWDGTYTEKGKKHRITLRTKQSSKALENMVREVEKKVQNRKVISESGLTVQEYARTWLSVYKFGLELNTREMYQNIIEKHLEPLRLTRLSNMRKVDVLVCLNAADGKSRTQEQILLTLKQVIKAAISDKYITPGIYPELFDGIKIKRVKKTGKRPLTELERKAVFSADFTDMQRAFVYIIYGCGLRRGEALALTRSDFDFKSKKLKVNKSLAFDKNSIPFILGILISKTIASNFPPASNILKASSPFTAYLSLCNSSSEFIISDIVLLISAESSTIKIFFII